MKKMLFVVAGSILFSACNTNVETPPTVAKVPDLEFRAESPLATVPEVAKIIQISISSFIPKETPFGKTYLEQINLFEKKYPHIKINHVFDTTANFLTDIVLDFKMNHESDILFLPVNIVEEQISLDKISDISQIKKIRPTYAENIPENALLLSNEVDNLKLGVPINGYYSGLYYNTNIFEELNLPIPKSYEDFLSVAEALKANNINPMTAALSYDPLMVFEQILLSTKNSDDQANDSGITKAMIIEAEDSFDNLMASNIFDEQSKVNTPIEAQAEFFEGNAAMIIEGNYIQNQIGYPSFSRMMPFPYEYGTNSQYIGKFNTGFILSKQGFNDLEKQSAIIEFINFMTSNASLELYKLANGGISPTDLNKAMYIASPLTEISLVSEEEVLKNIKETLEGRQVEALVTDSKVSIEPVNKPWKE
ncbi:MAG: hypothetical protein ATN31_00775 [Candidatus Epulonipiscioides saccharophilum]|nr:MAG: hypothetical protein ATN31_00775 [Epulopiscium sp. AS2M-Bin001]